MHSSQCLLLLWGPRYSRWRPAAVFGYCFCYINSFQFSELISITELKLSPDLYITVWQGSVNGKICNLIFNMAFDS